MNVAIQVSIPEDLLQRIQSVGADPSTLLEGAMQDYLWRLEKGARESRDAETINRCASRLNREAEDVLHLTELS